MAKLSIVVNTTSQTVNIFIQDSSKTDGSGLTGLVYNSTGLIAYYVFAQQNSVAITLATLANPNSAWSSGGFKEIDATHMPGLYRLDVPNAALASGNGRSVVIVLSGATHMPPTLLEIELTGVDNQDSVRMGMSALPAGPTMVKKNQALNAFEFPMFNASGTGLTGLVITAQRSIDGAAFAACANTPVELSGGYYKVDLAATDLNGNVIGFKMTAAGSQDTDFTIVTQP